MISQTKPNKPIKPYKLEAALPGQTHVRPWRQVVEAAVQKTQKDDKVRVLYVKSTAPSAEQSPQPFVTTKFASRREDEQDRLTAPRKVAREQHEEATKRMVDLVKPMLNLSEPKHAVRQTSHSITDLCTNDNTKLFGLPCTQELLRQLKQIEAEQQAQGTAQQQPPTASHATNHSPKPLPVPPLKLTPEKKSASSSSAMPAHKPSGPQTERSRSHREHRRQQTAVPSATASSPTTPLHSETSTEESLEQSSPGTAKMAAKSTRRQLRQEGTRRNVKDSGTTRHTPNPYEQWEQRISSLQELFFAESSPKPALSIPVSPRREPLKPQPRPKPRLSTSTRPETVPATPEPAQPPPSTPDQAPQTDSQ